MKALHRGLSRRAAAAGAAALLAVCLGAAAAAAAQGTASVSGKVSDGERGLAGVPVSLISTERGRRPRSARTDSEGRYRFDGVEPGRYQLLPHAPAFISAERAEGWPPGSKAVNVLAGDTIEDVDFRMTRGGVVTGRVTDADGQPIIGEQVSVLPAEMPAGQGPPQWSPPQRLMTDDRGVYRAYGLMPGRYRVSVGVGGGVARYGGPRRYYQRTFHPDTTEEARAAFVEVTAGGETEGVDITVGRAIKTFKATGRVVSPETGQPLAGVRVGVGSLDQSGRRLMGYVGGQPTGSRGEFAVDSLVPGRYAALIVSGPEQSEWYSEPVVFSVRSEDVTGIEVKARRGSTLSGVVQIEGLSDRAVAARMLAQVRVYAYYEPGEGLTAPGPPITASAAGGTFHLTGLRPGKLRLGADLNTGGLGLSRVEVNGADVGRNAIQIAEGAQLSGVRLVLIHATGVLRGQVALEGDALPPETRVFVMARRVGSESPFERQAQADTRGRFQIEGLPAGTYEVSARAVGFGPGGRRFEGRRQQVFVGDGAEQQVTLTLEPATGPPAPRRPQTP